MAVREAGRLDGVVPTRLKCTKALRRYIGISWGRFPFPGYVGDVNDKDQKFKKPKFGPLPIVGLPVQVQCNGFKCMAFRDQTGRWVDLFTREFVPGVLGVVPGC